MKENEKELDPNFLFTPWCYWDNAFTETEINKIAEFSSKKELMNGTTTTKINSEEYRESKVNFHEYNEENKWIFERLNSVIRSINDKYYQFELGGYDSYQYSEYYSSTKGRYDFHMDLVLSQQEVYRIDKFRKLSLAMLLNEPYIDFEGGDFQINVAKESNSQILPTKKGRIIIFPSFILHRVTPVTEGVRKSLVVWVEGPRFK